MAICNDCGKENRSGSLVCEDCGLPILSLETQETPAVGSGETRALTGTSKLSADFIITLDIPSADKNITLRNVPEVLLGRFEEGHPGTPHVDFSDAGNFESA